MMGNHARAFPRRADTPGSASAICRRITARIVAQDRAWFAAHPGENRYVRPYVPGEFWPDHPPAGVDLVVLVTQLAPGIRTRRAVAHLTKRPDRRMTMIDPFSGSVLLNVPMEGWEQ